MLTYNSFDMDRPSMLAIKSIQYVMACLERSNKFWILWLLCKYRQNYSNILVMIWNLITPQSGTCLVKSYWLTWISWCGIDNVSPHSIHHNIYPYNLEWSNLSWGSLTASPPWSHTMEQIGWWSGQGGNKFSLNLYSP